jgi:uncharacterized membrane protein
LGGIGLLLGYPVAIHYSVATGRIGVALAAVVALALLSVIVAVAHPVVRLGAGVVVVALVFLMPHGLVYVPPVAINLALAWWFGKTLAAGREPLITRFARLERPHARLDSRQLAYARRLTWVWTLFFCTIAMVSAVLAAIASDVVWSRFTNGASYAAALLLFLGEHLFRRVRFRGYTFASPFEQVGVLFRSAARGPRESA